MVPTQITAAIATDHTPDLNFSCLVNWLAMVATSPDLSPDSVSKPLPFDVGSATVPLCICPDRAQRGIPMPILCCFCQVCQFDVVVGTAEPVAAVGRPP